MQNQEEKSMMAFNFKKEQKIVAYSLIASIVAVNSIILLAPTTEEQEFYGNILNPLTAAVAVAFSIIVVCRQKLDGLFGRAYVSLAIGLALWLAAEIIWGYYSVAIQIEVPFPSIADILWLAGYGPLGYHLFTTAKLYRIYAKITKRLVAVSIAVAAFSIVYIFSVVSASELSGSDATLALGISIAYPVADAVIIIPAVLAISNSGRGALTAIPWIFISWILTTVADSMFGYTVVTDIAGDISVWNLIYNAAYLSMAAGLYWHNRFFVLDEKKMEKHWLKRYR